MKKYSVYLHQDVIDVLECFGRIGDVLTKMMKTLVQTDLLDGETLGTAPPREDARRIEFFVDDDTVMQLTGLPLRQIIYWFVENEVYDQLGWKPIREYREREKTRIVNGFDRALSELSKLNFLVNNSLQDVINTLEERRRKYDSQ